MTETPSGPPTAGPEHERLAPFEGRFRATVKLWMGPGDPMVTTGVMVNSFQVGGLYLHQDYQGDATEGPFPSFVGKGYWGYNTTSQCYEGFWIDNASTQMQTEQGQVDESGKVWEMHSEFVHPQAPGPMKRRTVITLIDDDHHSMETYMGSGAEESKSMEIQYVRDGG